MTTARFVPRSYAAPPKHFGNRLNVEWDDPSTLDAIERDRLGAAQVQHRVAIELRRHFALKYGTVPVACLELGLKKAKTERMLRGEAPMQTEDLFSYARILDRTVVSFLAT